MLSIKMITLFMGLVMIIIGIVWLALVFTASEKVNNNDIVILKPFDSFDIQSKFVKNGIGFYRIYIPEFIVNKVNIPNISKDSINQNDDYKSDSMLISDELFIQILNVQNNVIHEEKIQTKMSVGYFDFEQTGIYTAKIANISERDVGLHIEFGSTDSRKMVLGGSMVFAGAIIVLIVLYIRIKNYNMEQPEPNIS